MNLHFEGFLSQLDDYLRDFFAASRRKATRIHPRYEILWSELERVTMAGGKRIRPKMTLLSYAAQGGQDETALLPVAAALEVLHSSLLIHDDIIDRELTRRGSQNISGIYVHEHYEDIDSSLRRHYSDSAALLGGDLLLSAAPQLLRSCTLPTSRVTAAETLLHRAIFEVGGGQLLDMEATLSSDWGVPPEHIARYKTAGYSFIAPLMIDATLAGASKSTLNDLEIFATNVGIAFQLHDDIIGVFGDESVTGKSASGDLREGKRTYLITNFLEHATPAQSRAFQKLFTTPDLKDADIARLRQMLQENGVVERTKEAIDSYIAKSRLALSRMKLTADNHAHFEQLIALSTSF